MLADTAAVRFALDVTLKVTILLAAAGIARLLLRRVSAAGRHALTTLALAGAALLPLFLPLVPRLRGRCWHIRFPNPESSDPRPPWRESKSRNGSARILAAPPVSRPTAP